MNPLDLRRMTRLELFELARSNNLRVTSTMTKAELIETIEAAAKRLKGELKPAGKEVAPAPAKGTEVPKARKTPKKEIKETAIRATKPAAAKPPSEPEPKVSVKATVKKAIKALEEAEEKIKAKKEGKAPRTAIEARGAEKALASKEIESAKRLAKKILSGAAGRKATPTIGKVAEPEKPVSAAAARREIAEAKKEEAAVVKKEEAKSTKKTAPPKPQARAPRAKALSKRAEAKKRVEPSKRPTEEEIRRMAEEGKYYLGAEQRIMPPVEAIEIPSGYNVDRIVALVRDPFWVFAYWEVTDRKRRELERIFGDMWPQCRMVLRVYDLTEKHREHFDITLTNEARNWYINVSAARRYQVAIGALSPDGRFEQIAVSNIVETPSGRVSDRVDEHWMIPDEVFDRIFAASGGFDMHASSAELRGLMERHLLEQITSGSGAISSFGSGAWPARKGRGFRLWVATELILYGGTDPDARVTVQGKEVKLRPDGTFSLRFALPDGKLELPVEAESADGVETRRIETGVTKKSTTKEPVTK